MEARRYVVNNIDFWYADSHLNEDCKNIKLIEEKDIENFLHEDTESINPEFENPNYLDDYFEFPEKREPKDFIHLKQREMVCDSGFVFEARCGYRHHTSIKRDAQYTVRLSATGVDCLVCLKKFERRFDKLKEKTK